jgi:hypothetical protein
MIRFLHTSDLHLGKPFGRFPEDVRARLRLARFGAIARLADAARRASAPFVLLAGDTFDAETPAPSVIRQAVNAMAADPALQWIILPGNHDSLAATELWRNLAANRPGNVTVVMTGGALPLGPDAVLLTAPCTARRPGRDLTEALSLPTAPGLIRIGLAHGAVTDFVGGPEEDGNPAIIPPDRARLSGLDYLALGDWHGQIRIGQRQWYSGTPEADSFKHGGRGSALMVTVRGQDHLPEVSRVVTGQLDWQTPQLDLQPGDATQSRLLSVMPDLAARIDTLVDLSLSGRLSLSGAADLRTAIFALAPDLLWCEARWDGLSLEPDITDLGLIGDAGALRDAADRLAATASDQNQNAAARAMAATALARLFAFATEAA